MRSGERRSASWGRCDLRTVHIPAALEAGAPDDLFPFADILDHQGLLDLLAYEPNLHLDQQCSLEYDSKIFVSTETIRPHLKAANRTNKRLHKIASQRDQELRDAYNCLVIAIYHGNTGLLRRFWP